MYQQEYYWHSFIIFFGIQARLSQNSLSQNNGQDLGVSFFLSAAAF